MSSSEQPISILFPDDYQAILLDGDSRLMVTYGDPMGEHDVLPDPVVDLTVGGNRMMVPMYWGLSEKELLPHVGGLRSLFVRDRCAGATLTITATPDVANVELDVSTDPTGLDHLILTSITLSAAFRAREWLVYVLDPQLAPERQLGWSRIWRPEVARAILRDLNSDARVLTVDQFELGSGNSQARWKEMIPVPGGTPAAAARVISSLPPDCGVELVIVPG